MGSLDLFNVSVQWGFKHTCARSLQVRASPTGRCLGPAREQRLAWHLLAPQLYGHLWRRRLPPVLGALGHPLPCAAGRRTPSWCPPSTPGPPPPPARPRAVPSQVVLSQQLDTGKVPKESGPLGAPPNHCVCSRPGPSHSAGQGSEVLPLQLLKGSS